LRGSRVAWAAPEMVPSRAAASSGTGLSASQRSQPDAGKDGVMVLAATLDVSCASTMCRSSPRALPPIWRETERGAPEFKEVSPGARLHPVAARAVPAAAVRELRPESLFSTDGAAATSLRAGPSSRSGRFPDGAGPRSGQPRVGQL